MTGDKPKYNWDILTTEAPLAHEALRARFRKINKAADAEKSSSRRRGYMAVTLGAASLLVAAVAWLLEGSFAVWLSRAAALAGIGSIAIGLFGLLYARTKRRWLEHRYQTERLRQFHFQSAIALLPELLSQKADPANDGFTRHRADLFKRFSTLHLDAAAGERLNSILEDEEAKGWMFGDLPTASIVDNEEFRSFERDYRHYRLAAQIDYCDKKIGRRRQFLIPQTVAEQAFCFSTLAISFILGATVLHIIAALVPHEGVGHGAKWLHVGVLWLAVGVLALRALEEGLRPQRETERYRNYKSALLSVEERLNASVTPSEKIAAMKQLERISFEEMANFLKDHDEARFVM
jgi:hypothetical protein